MRTTITGTDGKLPSLPDASRGWYTFDGWCTQAGGGDKVGTDTVFDQDTTVYAHWKYSSALMGAIEAGAPRRF